MPLKGGVADGRSICNSRLSACGASRSHRADPSHLRPEKAKSPQLSRSDSIPKHFGANRLRPQQQAATSQ